MAEIASSIRWGLLQVLYHITHPNTGNHSGPYNILYTQAGVGVKLDCFTVSPIRLDNQGSPRRTSHNSNC